MTGVQTCALPICVNGQRDNANYFTIDGVSAIVGLLTIAVGRREWSAKIPFGPYLALGALVWLFRGPQILAWYFALSQPGA